MEACVRGTEIDGVELNPFRRQITFDLSKPGSFIVVGINPLTGKTKQYILRVNERGLCLV